MPMDFSSDRSIFSQVAERIENDILRGILMVDEQVPSTNELARMYSINSNTAAKALSVLFAEEILYKKRGVGMFVAASARAKILEKRRASFKPTYLMPMLEEANSLEISKDDLIKNILEEKK